MKLPFTIFCITTLGLVSCTSGPVIRETGTVDPATGNIIGSTTIFLGGTLAAKRKGVVTQVKKTGKGDWSVAYMVDSESSESVPLAGMAAYGMLGQAKETASVDRAREVTTQNQAVQETARHAKTVDGQVQLGSQAIGGGTPVTLETLKTP